MTKEFVRILCDVHCEWEGLPPIYRVFVNDELFAERTWIWTDCYLEELLQIEAEPGTYHIHYETVQPCLATLNVSNIRVDHGKATVNGSDLRIDNAII